MGVDRTALLNKDIQEATSNAADDFCISVRLFIITLNWGLYLLLPTSQFTRATASFFSRNSSRRYYCFMLNLTSLKTVSSPKYLTLPELLSLMGDKDTMILCTFAHLNTCSQLLMPSKLWHKCFLHSALSLTLAITSTLWTIITRCASVLLISTTAKCLVIIMQSFPILPCTLWLVLRSQTSSSLALRRGGRVWFTVYTMFVQRMKLISHFR